MTSKIIWDSFPNETKTTLHLRGVAMQKKNWKRLDRFISFFLTASGKGGAADDSFPTCTASEIS